MIHAFLVLHIFSMSSSKNKIRKILKLNPAKNIVITVGNPLRSDDGIGSYIASNLQSIKSLQVFDAGFSPENIIEDVVREKPEKIIFIDAADFSGKPGEVRVINRQNLLEKSISTHTVPLIVIASILKKDTNADIYFIGIQPVTLTFGERLSPEVKHAADNIINVIKKGIESA